MMIKKAKKSRFSKFLLKAEFNTIPYWNPYWKYQSLSGIPILIGNTNSYLEYQSLARNISFRFGNEISFSLALLWSAISSYNGGSHLGQNLQLVYFLFISSLFFAPLSWLENKFNSIQLWKIASEVLTGREIDTLSIVIDVNKPEMMTNPCTHTMSLKSENISILYLAFSTFRRTWFLYQVTFTRAHTCPHKGDQCLY